MHGAQRAQPEHLAARHLQLLHSPLQAHLDLLDPHTHLVEAARALGGETPVGARDAQRRRLSLARCLTLRFGVEQLEREQAKLAREHAGLRLACRGRADGVRVLLAHPEQLRPCAVELAQRCRVLLRALLERRMGAPFQLRSVLAVARARGVQRLDDAL